jgi:hypothetical protein
LECPGEVESKLKIPSGGMMMSRRLLRRRNIISDAYTWIYRSVDNIEKYKMAN